MISEKLKHHLFSLHTDCRENGELKYSFGAEHAPILNKYGLVRRYFDLNTNNSQAQTGMLYFINKHGPHTDDVLAFSFDSERFSITVLRSELSKQLIVRLVFEQYTYIDVSVGQFLNPLRSKKSHYNTLNL